MSLILGLMLLLGTWQYQFVIDAINANVFLNMTIFGTFGFGVFIAYRNVFNLNNEVVAYDALREEYSDCVNGEAQDKLDPDWRNYRCREEAVVFSKPKIMEQPFQIITEELARTGNLALTTGVMQNLLDSIDDRLDEGKSLVQYITGILVFLGLIGTFVGLMATLGSVGDIIGGLDLAGGAGAEAIQGLMNDLKVPLQGMATGFSSSLFGLITSLALGLMARFANRASGVLKLNVETWFAGIATVDAGSNGHGGANSIEREKELSVIYRVARLSLVANSRMVSTIDRISETTNAMCQSQMANQSLTSSLAESYQNLNDSQKTSNNALLELSNCVEKRGELSALAKNLKSDVELQNENSGKVKKLLGTLIDASKVLRDQNVERLAQQVKREDVAWLVDDANERLTSEFKVVNSSVDNLNQLMSLIDENIGKNSLYMQMNFDQFHSNTNELRDELGEAISKSKELISNLEEIESAEEENPGVNAMKSRLQNAFPNEENFTEELRADEPKKSRFSFFSRSA
ncbi:MAG: hypothetical protein AAF217_10165 [Pseudomonadota bacterium]